MITWDHIEILFWIAAAGAFGGFVDGLIVSRSYALRWKKTTVDIGSVGDILVGSAAGLAIFTVATAIFNLKFDELNKPEMFVKLVAWGVLSGFAGLRLLEGMSKKLVEDIATKVAEDTVKRVVTQDVEAEINIKSGDAALTKYDMAKESGWLQTREADARSLLETAILKFDAVLEKQPDNQQALRGKAKTHRRRAELEKVKGNSKGEKENWDKAIGFLSRIIDRSPNASIAYYNLACYQQLSGGGLTDVIGNLRKAIDISPILKGSAKSDPDFEDIRNKGEFKELIQ